MSPGRKSPDTPRRPRGGPKGLLTPGSTVLEGSSEVFALPSKPPRRYAWYPQGGPPSCLQLAGPCGPSGGLRGPSEGVLGTPVGPGPCLRPMAFMGRGGGLALFAESLGPLLRQTSRGRSPASSWLKSHFFPEGSRHTVPFGLAKRALCGSSHEAWAAPTGMMACWMSCAMMLVVCSDGARLNHAGRHWLPCAIMRLVGSDGLMALLRTAWAVIG